MDFGRFQNHDIICCLEDVECDQEHAANLLCPECTFPMCFRCLQISSAQEDTVVTIPGALANDNLFGFALDIVYKYKVRYIECAAASPLSTALIAYYVEGNKGHMLNVRQHKPQRAYAIRGNIYSFHMPWEDIAAKLGAITAEDAVASERAS